MAVLVYFLIAIIVFAVGGKYFVNSKYAPRSYGSRKIDKNRAMMWLFVAILPGALMWPIAAPLVAIALWIFKDTDN